MHADGVGVQFPKMAHLGEGGDADPEPLRRHWDRAGQLVQVCARLFVGQPDRNLAGQIAKRLFVQVPTGRLFFDVQPRRDCSDPPANQFTYMSPRRNEVEAPQLVDYDVGAVFDPAPAWRHEQRVQGSAEPLPAGRTRPNAGGFGDPVNRFAMA